jgi:hypothetical protein
LCTFSAHNLVRDPPFSRMDLVSWRNLLIYMEPRLQAAVIPAFHYSLLPGGVLLLGGAESTAEHGHLFEPLDKTARIFLRRDVRSPALNLHLYHPDLALKQTLVEGSLRPATTGSDAAAPRRSGPAGESSASPCSTSSTTSHGDPRMTFKSRIQGMLKLMFPNAGESERLHSSRTITGMRRRRWACS